MEYTCKLYDFNADDKKLIYDPETSRFTIQLFGLDSQGKTYSILVNDFTPFFIL